MQASGACGLWRHIFIGSNWYSGLLLFVLVAHSFAALPPWPLEDIFQQASKNLQNAPIPKPTGLTKNDYLDTISGIVSFFRQYQSANGSIVDPYAHYEIQYATPTYAMASAVLSSSTRDNATIASGILALECALTEMANDRVPQNHTNFFTLPIMLAIEIFRPIAGEDKYQYWLSMAAKINTKIYSCCVGNWVVVATGGEWLRYLHGLTDSSWLETQLGNQLSGFDEYGMYNDPSPITNPPMPYDIFPRHYVEVALLRGYNGTDADTYAELMRRGALTSLLMQSPWGEWPTGGRSSQHQWNEAVQCVIYEIRAAMYNQAGDTLLATAFKRAARIAHASLRRWRRPAGDLNIIHNRFDPSLRFGYEGYSFCSQYNNLPASMLAMAYLFADDTIEEGASFAETGGFVFAVPGHHKIFANVQGTYLEFETQAEQEHDATGLTRVHHPSFDPLIGPTSGSPIPVPRAVGIGWKKGEDYENLAQFTTASMPGPASLSGVTVASDAASFTITYNISGSKLGVMQVIEQYNVTSGKISASSEVMQPVDEVRFLHPAFLFDGLTNSTVEVEGNRASIAIYGTARKLQLTSPAANLTFLNDQIVSRNGYNGLLYADLPPSKIFYDLL